MRTNYCNVMVTDTATAAALGNDPWNHQVTAAGLYPSRAAFARALAALVYRKPQPTDDARMARWVKDMGDVSSNLPPHAADWEPGVLYVHADKGGAAWHRLDQLSEGATP